MKNDDRLRGPKAPGQALKKRGRRKSGQLTFNQWLFQTMADGQRAERGEVRNLILDALCDQARHGYDIIREIAKRSQEVYSPSTGVVYPALHMLEESGFVRCREENGHKIFEITDNGRQELEKNREEVQNAYDRLSGHIPVLRGESFQAMGKQVDRIFKSLKKSFQHGKVGTDRADKICAVLEEAATQIETILKDKKR